MLALVFTSLLPQATIGDQICFDIESGAVDNDPRLKDDEFGEDTESWVCAWQEPSSWESTLTRRCRKGVKRDDGRTEFGCIQFPDGVFVEKDNFKVAVLGDDALWIDRLLVTGMGPFGHESFKKEWGVSDQDGWCMSMTERDYHQWDGIDTQNVLKTYSDGQNVPQTTCYAMMRFLADGDAQGYHEHSARELPVEGADGKFYGLATDGKVVERSGRYLLDANEKAFTLGLDESFSVDAEGRPTVFKADAVVAPNGTLMIIEARRRSTEGRRLSLDEPATPIEALAELISNAEGQ